LDAANLVMVRAKRPANGLWAFEAALSSPAIAGAVLTLRGTTPDMVARRRRCWRASAPSWLEAAWHHRSRRGCGH